MQLAATENIIHCIYSFAKLPVDEINNQTSIKLEMNLSIVFNSCACNSLEIFRHRDDLILWSPSQIFFSMVFSFVLQSM